MDTQPLTFSALEQQIEALPQHPSYRIAPTRRARWGTGIGMVAGLSGLVLSKMLPPHRATLIAAIVLMVIEIVAFLVAWTAELPDLLNLRPSRERRQYAEALDYDLPHHLRLVAWIGSFPRERREAMSAFASHRLDRFRAKLPLLTGGIEKLGFLPLAAALILQFKDMRWPLHPSWAEIVLIGTLMLLYWMTLMQLGLRFRLELYDALLKKSLAGPG